MVDFVYLTIYQCPHCNKASYSKKDLDLCIKNHLFGNVHWLIINKKKIYACGMCEKTSIVVKDALKCESIHTSRKDYYYWKNLNISNTNQSKLTNSKNKFIY